MPFGWDIFDRAKQMLGSYEQSLKAGDRIAKVLEWELFCGYAIMMLI